MPPLKGTKESLSCVQRFLYLVSSSVNVSIVRSTWLDPLWTALAYPKAWKAAVGMGVGTPVFTAVVSIMGNRGKQSKCPSADEWKTEGGTIH